MDNYIVSARKYRPMTFDTVVGQSSLTVTLKNAIRNGKLAHAYLFCGPRGVGKTTCARIFAKTINCLSPKENGEACNECESCVAFNEQRSYNIHELDAASNNSVDDIRALIEQVRIPPQIGKYKVFIIDEVHMLSQAAFNAFLKTLEEPPHHAIFILATTEKHKLLATILSRCQIYDFNRMGVDDIVAHLANVAAKEGITCEPAALNVIAQKADGGMRDALSIFDQVASFCQGNITYQRTIENLNVLDSDYYFKLTDYMLACGNGDKNAPKVEPQVVMENITNSMLTLNAIINKGFDAQHFINGFSSHFRNLLVSRDPQTTSLIEASDEIRQKYQQQAQRCTPRLLFNAMRLCNDCDLQYKQSQNKRLLVELTLIELAQTAQGEDIPGSGRSPKKKLSPLFAGGLTQSPTPALAASPKVTATANVAANIPSPAPAATTTHVPSSPVTHVAPVVAPVASLQQNTVRRATSFSIRQSVMSLTKPAASATDQGGQSPSFSIENPESLNGTNKEVSTVDSTSFLIAWKEFVSQMPKNDTAIAQRMNVIEPETVDEGRTFEIIADNPMIMEQLNRYVPSVLQYIRKRLLCPSLNIKVRQRKMEDRKRALNHAEQLQVMCQQNHALQILKDALQLEIK